MMVAIHAYAPAPAKAFSLASYSHGFRCRNDHNGPLRSATVDRQIDAADLPGRDFLFSWKWPSVAYALDIAAWDWLLGLSMLLVIPAFSGTGGLLRSVRATLFLGGLLSLGGVAGPALGNVDPRWVGQVGYAESSP